MATRATGSTMADGIQPIGKDAPLEPEPGSATVARDGATGVGDVHAITLRSSRGSVRIALVPVRCNDGTVANVMVATAQRHARVP